MALLAMLHIVEMVPERNYSASYMNILSAIAFIIFECEAMAGIVVAVDTKITTCSNSFTAFSSKLDVIDGCNIRIRSRHRIRIDNEAARNNAVSDDHGNFPSGFEEIVNDCYTCHWAKVVNHCIQNE